MRILITTPWGPQGLTTLSIFLREHLQARGHMVGLHAWRSKYEAIGHRFDTDVFQGTFEDAASSSEVVIFPEVVEPIQLEWCRKQRIKTIWIPMWEYVGKERVEDRNAFTAIICPTVACYKLLRSLGAPNAHHVQWHCRYPVRTPRPTPEIPLFGHCIRGVSGDIRNTSVLIEAFRLYRQQGGLARLRIKTLAPLMTVVGPEHAETVRQLGDAVEVIEGAMDWDKMSQLLSDVDLFVYPTRREGLCLVIQEALASSVPVLATDCPPVSEYVEDGKNGGLIPADRGRAFNNIREAEVQAGILAECLRRMDGPRTLDELKGGCLEKLNSAEAQFTVALDLVFKRLDATPFVPAHAIDPDYGVTDLLMVTHDRHAMTRETVRTVENATKTPYRWIIVDNGSTDNTLKWLRHRQWAAPCRLICNTANVGKAAAMNQALYLSDGDFITFMDNDIIVPAGWLTSMIDILTAFPEIGCTSLCFSPKRHPITEVGLAVRKIRLRPIGSLSGAAMAFHRSLHERLGFCDTAFGQYGLFDAEWCYRTRLLGLQLAHPEAPGIHLGENDDADYCQKKSEARKVANKVWVKRTRMYVSGEAELRLDYGGEAPAFESLGVFQWQSQMGTWE